MFTEKSRRRRPWLAVVDALATPHGADRYLEWIRPTWTLRQARATLARISRPAPGSLTLHLRPNRCWAGFTAGQHVELGVEIDGVRHTRCYSPAGSAHRAGELELTVAVRPGGRVSRWLHAAHAL
jgi:ferredoxin-NADP reductase